MTETVDVVACPSCGKPATLRFCGHCGALVRPRRAPATPDDDSDEPAEAADAPAPDDEGEAPAARPSPATLRHRWAVVATLVVAVLAAAVQLRPPPPETVTLPGGATAGAGGTGLTSDRAVTDLTRRWDAPGRGTGLHPGGGWPRRVETARHMLLQLDDALLAFDQVTGEQAWRLPQVGAVPGADSDAMLVFTPGELAQVQPDSGRVVARTTLDRAVAGDQLAVTVGDDLVVAPAPVSGFDRRTGQLRWRHDGTWLQAASGEVGVVHKERTRVIDLRDGSTLWEVPANSDGWAQVEVARDVLVVLDGRLTVHDLRSGDVRWRVDPPGGGSGPSQFAIHGDRVLAFAHDRPPGDDPARGAWWGFHLDGRPFDVPAALPATLPHALTADGTWIHASDDPDAGVVARRGDQVLWRRQLQANEIVALGPFAAVATNEEILLLDAATGEEIDRFRPATVPSTGPSHTVLEDCVVSAALREVAVRIADGEPCYEPGRARRLDPQQILAGEGVSVVQTAGELQGVGRDGEERWSRPVSGRNVVGLTPGWIALVDEQRAASHGRPEGDLDVALLDTRTGETPVALALDGVPWDWSGRGDVALVRLYDPRTEEPRLELWALPTDDRRAPERRWALRHPSGAPVVLEDDVAIAVGSTMLVEHDLADGSVRRRVPFAVRLVGRPALHRDVAVGTADRDRLVGLDRGDGSLRWDLALAGEVLGGPTIAGDIAYVTVAPREVVLVDVGSGAVRATLQLDADLTGPAVAAAGRLLVSTTAGVMAFGPALSVSSPARRPAR